MIVRSSLNHSFVPLGTRHVACDKCPMCCTGFSPSPYCAQNKWPGCNSVQSSIKSHLPGCNSVQSSIKSHMPGCNSVQSSIKSHLPGCNSVQSSIKSHLPGCNSVQSSIKSHLPGCNSVQSSIKSHLSMRLLLLLSSFQHEREKLFCGESDLRT